MKPRLRSDGGSPSFFRSFQMPTWSSLALEVCVVVFVLAALWLLTS
jgi:hypothetical protein